MMRSLFAPARALFVGAALALGLGCAGAMNGAMQLAGVDMKMGMGDNAIHPTDFPASPPVKGEKAMSLSFTALGESIDVPPEFQLPAGVTFDPTTEYTLEIMVYTVEGSDLMGLCSTAKDEVAAKGWAMQEPDAQEDPDLKEMALFGKDQDLFAVMGTDDGEDASFVLFRIHPTEEATDAAPTEVEAPPERGVEEAPTEDEAPTK